MRCAEFVRRPRLVLSLAVPALAITLLPGLLGLGGQDAVSYAAITHKVGVYSLTNPVSVSAAARAGVQLAIAKDGGPKTSLSRAYAAHGVKYIDTSIQGLLYRTYCPGGTPASCRTPSLASLNTLMAHVKAHVKAVKGTGAVAAYYILDDYFTNMSGVMPWLYNAIRSVDTTTPTVCAFYQGLAYKNAAGHLVVSTSRFDEAMVNYSPQWCDAVAVYSYAPAFSSRKAPAVPAVEWSMASVLPALESKLEQRGWVPSKQPLIGVPSAFGYSPRTAKHRTTLEAPVWRYGPNSSQLATQIRAFCAAGAVSIVPYVWNDQSVGHVQELYNNAVLRAGVQKGTRQCRANNWH